MSKGQILLIEPDEDIREWIEAALETDSYEVWAVDFAERGLALVDKIEPHLLLLDNYYDQIEWNAEYIEFQYKKIPQIWMYQEKFRFDKIGEIIPPVPNASILKVLIKEEDRIKLRKATLAYRNRRGKHEQRNNSSR